MALAISSTEKPRSGYPLSKWRTICSSTPASEVLRQLIIIGSTGLPALDM